MFDETSDVLKLCPTRKKLAFSFFFSIFSSDMALSSPVMVSFLGSLLLEQTRNLGWKSSDNYLISDLFATPRTILEISANLERTFLGGKGGLGPSIKCILLEIWCFKFWKCYRLLNPLNLFPHHFLVLCLHTGFLGLCVQRRVSPAWRFYALFRFFAKVCFHPWKSEGKD